MSVAAIIFHTIWGGISNRGRYAVCSQNPKLGLIPGAEMSKQWSACFEMLTLRLTWSWVWHTASELCPAHLRIPVKTPTGLLLREADTTIVLNMQCNTPCAGATNVLGLAWMVCDVWQFRRCHSHGAPSRTLDCVSKVFELVT